MLIQIIFTDRLMNWNQWCDLYSLRDDNKFLLNLRQMVWKSRLCQKDCDLYVFWYHQFGEYEYERICTTANCELVLRKALIQINDVMNVWELEMLSSSSVFNTCSMFILNSFSYPPFFFFFIHSHFSCLRRERDLCFANEWNFFSNFSFVRFIFVNLSCY